MCHTLKKTKLKTVYFKTNLQSKGIFVGKQEEDKEERKQRQSEAV